MTVAEKKEAPAIARGPQSVANSRLARKVQMQGAPEADTGSVHERTLRMAAEEQRRRWAFIASLAVIS